MSRVSASKRNEPARRARTVRGASEGTGAATTPAWGRWLGAALAGAAPLALYLRTMAPTVYGVDGAELTTGAYLLGIVHPPGSPLYLLLGHVFSQLPFGDVGYRLNLFSACAATLALVFLYWVMLRLTRAPVLSMASCWFLGVTYYFWIAAVAAELYALQACFLTGLLALALRWRADGKTWQFALFCILFGGGTGNHLSLLLLAPGFAFLALSAPARRLPLPRLLLGGTACGLLGACVYLYLPLRYAADLPLNPARDYWHVDLTTFDGLWWMMSGQAFRSHYFAVALRDLPAQVGAYGYWLWSDFVGLGALLGIAGLVLDFRRRRWLHVSLLLMIAGHLVFYLPYGVGDKELMFLPTYVLFSIWVGLGSARIGERLAARQGTNIAGSAMLLGLALCTAAVNYRFADISADTSTREHGEAVLRELEPNSVFLGSWKDLRIIEYLQQVEHQRPDVQIMDFTLSPAIAKRTYLTQKKAAGLTVYTSSTYGLAGEEESLRYVEGCDCYRVLDSFPLDRVPSNW